MGDSLQVLCAGDRFIGAQLLASAARAAFGEDITVLPHDSAWPDEPFGAVDGVREAAGDPAELVRLVGSAEVLLTHLAPVTAAVLEAGTALGSSASPAAARSTSISRPRPPAAYRSPTCRAATSRPSRSSPSAR